MAEEDQSVIPSNESPTMSSEKSSGGRTYYRNDIVQRLADNPISEKDRERVRLLQAQLDDENISKNRRKKLWREIDWLANRQRRNFQKKEERKKRKLEIRSGVREPSQKRQRIVSMAKSKCKIRVALDLSLHSLMTNFERTKAGRQLQRCYASNRRTERPLQMYITGLAGAEYWVGGLQGFYQWDVYHVGPGHAQHFRKDQVVYLTSESENELTELVESEVYVIGCLVDHNRMKGVTLKRAVKAGLRHACLPLDRYVDMKTRKVLTIDHCFEILLNRVNGMSWQEAIIKAIPARKGAQLKDTDDNQECGSGDGTSEDEPDNISSHEQCNQDEHSTKDTSGDVADGGDDDRPAGPAPKDNPDLQKQNAASPNSAAVESVSTTNELETPTKSGDGDNANAVCKT